MAIKPPIVEFSEFDVNNVIADRAAIESVNPHRYELSLLDGVLFDDVETGRCVGYCDATMDAFWVRGHMPGMPLMPGVIMCECAAQLCSYFCLKYNMLDADGVGLGGLDEVRFRSPIVPGDRLIVMVQRRKLRRSAVVVSYFQGYVNEGLVVEGIIKGIPLPKNLV